MFKALDGMSDNEPQTKPKIEHRLVKGDYGSDIDIGVVSIDYTKEYGRKTHHWIRFPDGQVRKYYNWEMIDKARAEEMEAFDMAPRLKVNYRPITTELASWVELAAVIWACFLTALILDGAVMLIVHRFFSPEAFHFLFKSTIGTVIQDILWYAWGITGGIALVCYAASHRYYNDTPDDKIPHDWEREQLRKERDRDDSWI